MTECYFDGSVIENPGTLGAWGFIICDPMIKENGLIRGERVTSNTAEFTALNKLLDELENQRIERAKIYGDSKLVVDMVNGDCKCKADHLKPLARKAASRIFTHKLRWVPRERNKMADKLAQKAYQ